MTDLSTTLRDKPHQPTVSAVLSAYTAALRGGRFEEATELRRELEAVRAAASQERAAA